MSEILDQCNGGKKKYGNIINIDDLDANLKMNCIPDDMENMNVADYPQFLADRRVLMADKIKKYFKKL
jgi:hypothetical protein